MASPAPNDDFAGGTAGASARREHERRRANRERRTREKHPRLGKMLLALADEPTHERVWANGAEGEERVAAQLARYVDDDIRMLHDRRVPRSTANIDHIAVAPSGVWVIDAKRYTGTAEVRKGLFAKPKLMIAGRDRSTLADGLAGQVKLVEACLDGRWPQARVHGALCFVDTKLPLIGTLTFRGFPLVGPRRLAKRINASGPLDRDQIDSISRHIATALLSA